MGSEVPPNAGNNGTAVISGLEASRDYRFVGRLDAPGLYFRWDFSTLSVNRMGDCLNATVRERVAASEGTGASFRVELGVAYLYISEMSVCGDYNVRFFVTLSMSRGVCIGLIDAVGAEGNRMREGHENA